jgi:HD-GYP domain-containing protein (c-di-GMP phosphodiesterase class II)
MSNLNEILNGSELFAKLGPVSVERIIERLERVVFEQGTTIIHEGRPGDSMFIIVTGKVTVTTDMGWGQRELERKGPGSVFGEMALISDEPRSASVRALERTECLALGKGDFDFLLDQDPSIAQRVAKVMTSRLSALVHQTSNELLGAYRSVMFAIADLTDSRDPETGAHLERTRNYCVLLAEQLSRNSRFRDLIPESFIEGIFQVSPLHDVGKVAIPDSILLKADRLTPQEFEVMKTHSRAGAAAFDKVLGQSDAELFRMAHRICLHHHERWDGTGYPEGLAGDAIPLEARIMACADVYDAMLSRRPYKSPMSQPEAREEIGRAAGTQFDPSIAEVMLENIEAFEAIRAKYDAE